MRLREPKSKIIWRTVCSGSLGLNLLLLSCAKPSSKSDIETITQAPNAEPAAVSAAPASAVAKAAAETAVPPASAGLLIELDDAGNRIIPKPGAQPATTPARNALNRSSAGLTVERNSIARGGDMMRLQGRFKSYSVATIGPDGKVMVDCVSDPAENETGSGASAHSHGGSDPR